MIFVNAGSATTVCAADWMMGRAITAFGTCWMTTSVNAVASAVCVVGCSSTDVMRLVKTSWLYSVRCR